MGGTNRFKVQVADFVIKNYNTDCIFVDVVVFFRKYNFANIPMHSRHIKDCLFRMFYMHLCISEPRNLKKCKTIPKTEKQDCTRLLSRHILFVMLSER